MLDRQKFECREATCGLVGCIGAISCAGLYKLDHEEIANLPPVEKVLNTSFLD